MLKGCELWFVHRNSWSQVMDSLQYEKVYEVQVYDHSMNGCKYSVSKLSNSNNLEFLMCLFILILSTFWITVWNLC